MSGKMLTQEQQHSNKSSSNVKSVICLFEMGEIYFYRVIIVLIAITNLFIVNYLITSNQILLLSSSTSNGHQTSHQSAVMIFQNESRRNAEDEDEMTMQDFERIVSQRKERIFRVCADLRKKQAKLRYNPGNFYTFKQRKLFWCPVFKAGTTSLIHQMVDNDPFLSEEMKLEVKRTAEHPIKYLEPIATKVTSSSQFRNFQKESRPKGFIIVRHPFHRLVSAFRDKLEQINKVDREFYYRTYGKKIVLKFRKEAIKKFGKDFFSAANNYGALLPVKYKRDSDVYPMFWEFVQYVIKTPPNSMDEHWIPMDYYCSICSTDYDYVVKFEELSKESRLLHKALWPETKNSNSSFPSALALGGGEENSNGLEIESDDLTRKYFSLLSDEDVDKLYQIYRADFDLFGYEFRFGNKTYPR